jgi:hypothetical protein
MTTINLPRLHLDRRWFVDEAGRCVILRGINLGGDCKVPYPDGGTNFPSDFSNHRDVSFIGRPFPIEEAGEHFSRLRAWGFNCLRLLTTWEAVEHRGPNQYDTAYLDYFAELCRIAGDFGFYLFVDFHQDVWSRMTGGDGAPGWLFEKIGIDYRRIAKSGSAHVMQELYDFARGGRQEDRYPTMSWSQNARRPANGIMWTLFFAGRDFAPGLTIDRVAGTFEFVFDADPSVFASTEVFVPRLQYPRGCALEVSGADALLDLDNQRLTINANQSGEVRVIVRRSP